MAGRRMDRARLREVVAATLMWAAAPLACATSPLPSDPMTAIDAKASYAAAVQGAVLSHWRVPDSVREGDVCAVLIRQLPGGEVLDAKVQAGCEFDAAGSDALVAAVLRASPLPYEGHRAVFQRELPMRFVRPSSWPAKPAAKPPAIFASHVSDVRALALQDLSKEARCLAHPDLPGAEWAAGVGKARCPLVRPPFMSLDEIERQLGEPKGAAALDRRFADLLDAHYRDPAQREQIFIAYGIFDAGDAAARVAQRWLERSPASPYARTALGVVYARQGWAARGARWASETPRDQLDRMNTLFARAIPLLAEALQQEKRLLPACIQLAGIGRMSSDQLQRGAMSVCMAADPHSFYVLDEWMTQAEPRWGGSEEAMRSVAAYVAARVERHPVLQTLTVVPIGHDAYLADAPEDVIPDIVRASLMAPNARYMARAAWAMNAQGDRWRALVYVSQALRYFPDDDDELVRRSYLLLELDDPEWALRDAQRAASLAPDEGSRHYLLAQALRRTKGEHAARPSLRRAMGDPLQRERAYELYCQTYTASGELLAGEACAKALVAEFPRNAEGWRLLAWARAVQDDPSLADAVKQFEAHQDLKRWPHHIHDMTVYRAMREAGTL